MNWLKKNWFKIALLTIITFGFAAIVGSYLMVQIHKQESIERQQTLQMLQERDDKEREYKSNQKDACLAIYKQESTKWNNTSSWRHAEDEDKCYIQYKEETFSDEECDKIYRGEDGNLIPGVAVEWAMCKDGLFEKTF